MLPSTRSHLAFKAEGGDADAQYRLGVLFLLGEDVAQDPEAAWRWLDCAARGNHSSARLLIGHLGAFAPPVPDAHVMPRARIRAAAQWAMRLRRRLVASFRSRGSGLECSPDPTLPVELGQSHG